jgi:biotin operon repressor
MDGVKGYYCQELLLQELEARKAKNSMYSLRAFARDLGIGSTSLSDALASKRKLSRTNILKIAQKLSWSSSQIDLLLSEIKRGRGYKTVAELEKMQLEEDTFRYVADWHYLAIRNLAKIKDNKSDPAWIASKIGISESEAEKAVQRLVRMNLIEVSDNKMFYVAQPIITTTDVPSVAIKKHHKDKLRLAEKSLAMDSVEIREFRSTTMAIDPRKIEEAKRLLKETNQKLIELMESSDATEVYNFSFQLFPLTKGDE